MFTLPKYQATEAKAKAKEIATLNHLQKLKEIQRDLNNTVTKDIEAGRGNTVYVIKEPLTFKEVVELLIPFAQYGYKYDINMGETSFDDIIVEVIWY